MKNFTSQFRRRLAAEYVEGHLWIAVPVIKPDAQSLLSQNQFQIPYLLMTSFVEEN
jgi:hypothetical protein